MANLIRLISVAAALALAACSTDTAPVEEAEGPARAEAPADTPAANTPPPATPEPQGKFGRQPPDDTVATVFGRGNYSPDEKKTSFTIDVNFAKGGEVTGAMEFSMFDGGEKMDISADATCGSYDLETGRVWVGGIIDANRSTLARFQDERFGTGQPIWFRVAESATHPEPPARMTAPAFAGDGGHDDAAAFCDAKPWIAGDAGLHPIEAQSAVIVFALPGAVEE